MTNVEKEIKLVAISQDVLENILELEIINNLMLSGTQQEQALQSRYYDTKKRKFSKLGMVFRVRKEPNGYVATVKTEHKNSGGLSERMEYNVDLSSAVPDFAGFSKIDFIVDLPAIVQKQGGVQELFCVDVQRRLCHLALTEQTVVEMAVDIGTISAKDKVLPIAELEFELIKGDVKDLIDFIAKLSSIVPIYAQPKSKYFQGCELAGEQLTKAKSLQVTTIDDQKPFKQALLESIILQTGHALACLKDFLDFNCQEKQSQELLIQLNTLKNLLCFAKPLLQEDINLHIKALELLIKAGQENNLFFELQTNWQKILKQKLDFKITNIFTDIITQQMQKHLQKIQTNLNCGIYSKNFFALWAWLNKEPWQNIVELTAKDYVVEQIEKLDLLTDHQAVAALECAITLLEKSLPKDFIKLAIRLEKAIDIIAKEQKIQAISKQIFSLFKASSGRLIYRDAGLLLGFYLHLPQIKQEKLDKTIHAVEQLKNNILEQHKIEQSN